MRHPQPDIEEILRSAASGAVPPAAGPSEKDAAWAQMRAMLDAPPPGGATDGGGAAWWVDAFVLLSLTVAFAWLQLAKAPQEMHVEHLQQVAFDTSPVILPQGTTAKRTPATGASRSIPFFFPEGFTTFPPGTVFAAHHLTAVRTPEVHLSGDIAHYSPNLPLQPNSEQRAAAGESPVSATGKGIKPYSQQTTGAEANPVSTAGKGKPARHKKTASGKSVSGKTNYSGPRGISYARRFFNTIEDSGDSRPMASSKTDTALLTLDGEKYNQQVDATRQQFELEPVRVQYPSVSAGILLSKRHSITDNAQRSPHASILSNVSLRAAGSMASGNSFGAGIMAEYSFKLGNGWKIRPYVGAVFQTDKKITFEAPYYRPTKPDSSVPSPGDSGVTRFTLKNTAYAVVGIPLAVEFRKWEFSTGVAVQWRIRQAGTQEDIYKPIFQRYDPSKEMPLFSKKQLPGKVTFQWQAGVDFKISAQWRVGAQYNLRLRYSDSKGTFVQPIPEYPGSQSFSLHLRYYLK